MLRISKIWILKVKSKIDVFFQTVYNAVINTTSLKWSIFEEYLSSGFIYKIIVLKMKWYVILYRKLRVKNQYMSSYWKEEIIYVYVYLYRKYKENFK